MSVSRSFFTNRIKCTSLILVFVSNCACLAATSSAPSAPRLLPGSYRFSGEIKTVALYREEQVRGTSDEIEARSNQLISDGYECQRNLAGVSQTCRKAMTNMPPPPSELARAQAAEIEIGDVFLDEQVGNADLISSDATRFEWSVQQPLHYLDKTFDRLIMTLKLDLATNSQELRIRTPGGKAVFLVDQSKNTLGRTFEIQTVAEGVKAPTNDTVVDHYGCSAERILKVEQLR